MVAEPRKCYLLPRLTSWRRNCRFTVDSLLVAPVGCSFAAFPRARSPSAAARPPRSHRTDHASRPTQVRGKLGFIGDASARPVHPAAIVRAAISADCFRFLERLSVSLFGCALCRYCAHAPPGSERDARSPRYTPAARAPLRRQSADVGSRSLLSRRPNNRPKQSQTRLGLRSEATEKIEPLHLRRLGFRNT